MSAKRKLERDMVILQAQLHRRAIQREIDGLREAISPMRSMSGWMVGLLSLVGLRRRRHREGETKARWGLRSLVVGYVVLKRLLGKRGVQT
ncbi:MAG: hypothetical protein QM639_03395 [Rhodocyclaceae bacterium]